MLLVTLFCTHLSLKSGELSLESISSAVSLHSTLSGVLKVGCHDINLNYQGLLIFLSPTDTNMTMNDIT